MKELYRRYLSGEKIKDLAKELNISTTGLQYRFNSNGYKLSKDSKLVCKTSNLLNEINELFDGLLYLNKLKKKDVYTLVSSHYKTIKLLYNYFYSDASYFFERKRLKFKDAAIIPSKLKELK